MGKLSPESLPLIDVILFSYIELIFRGGVSCLPAALLLLMGSSLFLQVRRTTIISWTSSNFSQI